MYGALIPDEMINQDIKDSKSYKTYLDFTTGKATPKKARKFKKVASPSKRLSLVLEEEPAEKPKQAKKPTKKSSTMPTTCVVIRDSPSESVSKKKAPTKVDRGKGIYLLSEAALLEAAQLKKTLKKSKLKTHKPHASGSGDGVGSQPKVPGEQQDKKTGTDEGTDDDSKNDNSDDVSNDDDDDDDDNDVYSDVGGDSEASDSEKTDFDEDEIPNLNQNEDEEEEYEEELKDTEHEEERKGYAEMNDAGHDDDTQQTTYEQVKDDEHVILTLVHDTHKTEILLQSSSISSDFANQFLNLDNALLVDNAVVSMMNVKVCHEEPSTQTPSLLTIPVTAISETSTAAAPTIPPTIPPITPLPQQSYTAEFEKKAKDERKRYIDLVGNTITESLENVVLDISSSQPKCTYEAAASLTKFELKKILLDKMQKSKSYQAAQEHRDLYDALVKSYKLDKDLFESYGKSYSLKRDHEDKDKDEDPPAGSDQGLKRRKIIKDAEPYKGSKSKESKSSSSKGTKSQPKSSGKSAQFKKSKRPLTPDPDWNANKSIDFRPPQTWIDKIAKAKKPPLTFDELMSTPIDFSAYVINNLKINNLTQEHLFGPAFNLLKETCRSQVELEYHFEECYKVVTDRLD
ncbi:hypothetical protein Tco_0830215 [Tanacetum coccineum]